MTEGNFARYLYLPDLPEVDLSIRTSGEQRISNFLPWHTAYAEIIFDNVLWPDFDRAHLFAAISEYSRRERRFGETLRRQQAKRWCGTTRQRKKVTR